LQLIGSSSMSWHGHCIVGLFFGLRGGRGAFIGIGFGLGCGGRRSDDTVSKRLGFRFISAPWRRCLLTRPITALRLRPSSAAISLAEHSGQSSRARAISAGFQPLILVRRNRERSIAERTEEHERPSAAAIALSVC
jgi:hypothetical protein